MRESLPNTRIRAWHRHQPWHPGGVLLLQQRHRVAAARGGLRGAVAGLRLSGVPRPRFRGAPATKGAPEHRYRFGTCLSWGLVCADVRVGPFAMRLMVAVLVPGLEPLLW